MGRGTHLQDTSNPLFVRFYRRNRRSARKRGENERRRRALEGLSGRVAELGGGGALYPETVSEVVAIQPELRFRQQAQEAGREAGVAVRVLAGAAEALPLDDESVDAVVASPVLRTVPDPKQALAKTRRVQRPGGSFASTSMCTPSASRHMLSDHRWLVPPAASVRTADGCEARGLSGPARATIAVAATACAAQWRMRGPRGLLAVDERAS